MSTLDDLRETLERHADGLDDTSRSVRAAAVRRRVRGVRRRRFAATAIAAAVVVVVGVGAIVSFQPPRAAAPAGPAGPTVLGVAVPGEIAIFGFPYELSSDVPMYEGGDVLRVPDPRVGSAVSLVGAGLESGSATLFINDIAVARAIAGDPVTVPVPVPVPVADSDAGPAVRVELHGAPAHARTGVAIYRATGELALGVDNGSAVFREHVAGSRLLAAAFADEGQARTALSFVVPLHATSLATYCRTDEPGLWVRVEDGEVIRNSQCSDDPSADTRGLAWWGRSPNCTRCNHHVVEAYITRGEGGPVVTDADVSLGVAVYETGETVPIAGANVAEVVEHDGRTWRLDEELSRWDTNPAVLRLEADTDMLLGFVAKGEMVRATWRGRMTRGATSYADTGVVVEGLLLRGDTYDVALESEGPMTSGTFLVYRPE